MISKGGVFSVYMNMLKACVGGGILAYPYLFKCHGMINTVLFTIFFGSASFFGCLIYILLNAKYGTSNSMASLALRISPRVKPFVDFILISKCSLVTLAYILLIRDNVEELVKDGRDSLLNSRLSSYSVRSISNTIITLICLAILPLVCSRKIDRLKMSSFVGILGVLILTGASFFVKGKSQGSLEGSGSIATSENNNFNPFPSIGYFVFGFTCHQNIFSVQNDTFLHKRQLILTILFVYLTAAALYLSFGMINYSRIDIASDCILKDWEDSLVKKFAVLIYSLIISVSIPLQLHPTKNHIIRFFNINEESHSVSTGFILLFTIYFAVVMGSFTFKSAVKFVANSFSAIMCFIIPAYYFYYSEEKKSARGNLMAAFALTVGVCCIASLFLY